MNECFSNKFIYNDEIMCKEKFDEVLSLQGESVYEVIRIIDGVPLFLEKHLSRLINSAKIIDREIWLEKDEIVGKLLSLCEINNVKNGNVKMIFSFGKKNVFLGYFIKHKYPTKHQYEQGVDTMLFNVERHNPNAKIINKNLRDKTDKIIKEEGIYELILVNRNGNITEGSKSNIFLINKNEVITSPLSSVLPGVTREYIIEVCKKMNINIVERFVNTEELKSMEAAFISGTSPKILPIRKINDTIYSNDNKMLRGIMKGFDLLIDDYINEYNQFSVIK